VRIRIGRHSWEARPWHGVTRDRDIPVTGLLLQAIIPSRHLQAGINWLNAQVGKPYDWRVLFSVIMLGRTPLDDERAWACSEMAAGFFVKVQRPLHCYGRVLRGGISPRDCLLSPVIS
jgi:hypothetical protein